ncbi:UDP-glucose dehydrogenase family protein [Brumimicrobium aurantiacum]|uniref:UDP-glucose 6-dehydrogenase n=1 Tax=Brumimicrobium aurantiacum TaxID=1737063 RepID=A0A3E1EYS3_9FLAO|nr:UDP-glucose/GDP-mannose dehydrogenase family protein [Brumimicrobium aurantiacum]RFC54706.1 UDP-glucose/GDP-mannose dehydrogenase family protein [Brumimicrobium aurantiacum]
MKNIAVIGTGYVGLVTGTCFAETGNNVTCVDIDANKVERMKGGEVPIYEPHLDVLFERNIKQERLKFTTELAPAIEDAEIIFLALPTPPGEDGSADLSYVLGVAKDLGKIIKEFKVIVDKSTVPVGTADQVSAAIREETDIPFAVVSNPEFLREGFAVDDFMNPDRVVIGTEDEKAKTIMNELYQPFIRDGHPLIFMDEKSAELTKYAANSFLATKITFMNEVANFCEIVGADVDRVREGMGADTRIGHRFLYPGIGFGGSCFPKDVSALMKSGNDHNFNFSIIDAVLNVNNQQRIKLLDKVLDHFGDIEGKKFALWGLAFKPDTDDIREAPALYLVDELTKRGATITAFDPEAIDNVKNVIGDKIEYAKNQYEVLDGADALLIATEWSVFKNPDFNEIKSRLKSPIIFDGRNIFNLNDIREKGVFYSSIGRQTIIPKV